MRCSTCAAENREGRKFCAECGAPLNARCASCGAENEPAEKFCGECGVTLADKVQAVSASAPATKLTVPEIHVTPGQPDASAVPDGERKTVTAVFADIKGSMELMEELDPEAARAIVDPALKLMIEAVARYDGYVVQPTGDGIFALFGAPVAHEDHPQRALYAALRMQDEVRRYANRQRAEGRAPLQIRVGANTGEVVVRSIATGDGKSEYTPIGHTANLAARMQTLANPGSIVIAESTRKLVEGYFTLKSLGASRIKGVAEPVEVFEVTGLGPLRTRLQRSAGRGLTKFVGREREKDTGRVVALDRSLEDTLPYLFSLLGIVEGEDPLAQMDGQIKKRRTLEAIKRIVLRESLNQPLMIIFEDLHWIDEQSEALLNLLADSIAAAKIL